jgi:hypothetical protein
MKKKIFLVSTLVLMAMSAMFVACDKDDKNGAKDGCDCTWASGQTDHISAAEMSGMNATTCGELAGYLRAMSQNFSDGEGVVCK